MQRVKVAGFVFASLGLAFLVALSGCAGSGLCDLEAKQAREVAELRAQGLPKGVIIAATAREAEQDPSDTSIEAAAIAQRIVREVYTQGLGPQEAADTVRTECESGR